MVQLVKHYRHDAALRRSFNELAEATFGLNFENWYRNGFWGDCYDPYSVLVDGKIVANVSLNRTDMRLRDSVKRLYQLGTVMTAEDYRGKGYIRAIMEEIEKDIPDADGVYLFANDSVLDFYPKFGFRRGTEYVYTKQVSHSGPCRMERIPMEGPENWGSLQKAMDSNVFHSGCDMTGNPGLIFFYVSQFMKDCVFFSRDLNTYVVAECEEGELMIHNIFSPDPISLDDVISAFGSDVRQVTLGFSPADPSGFTCTELHEDDTTFFVKGGFFEEFEEKKLRIPTLSHA